MYCILFIASTAVLGLADLLVFFVCFLVGFLVAVFLLLLVFLVVVVFFSAIVALLTAK
jgi:hypothetical protein